MAGQKRLRAASLGALVATLAGCATDIYDKPGGTEAEFNVDQGYCEMVALGTPPVQAPYIPPTYTANTTYSGTYSGGMVNGMATTTVQRDNSGQAMANLGAGIGTAIRQKQTMHACMASRGYTLRK